MEGLIRGARATLRMQSFVTGVLYIAIDYFPDTQSGCWGWTRRCPSCQPSPQRWTNSNQHRASHGRFSETPLDTILNELLAMIKRANTLLETPELRQALVALRDVMTDTRQLLVHANNQVGSLGPKLAGTAEVASKALETLRVTLLDAQKLVRDVDGQVAPLAGRAKETLTAARSALGQAQKSLVTLTDAATPVLKQADKTFTGTAALTGPDSAVLNDLSRTLRALDEAARAIRTLASTLERNPEMLIRGRSK